MKTAKRVSKSEYALFGIIGGLVSIPLNYLVIHPILIPDECYYHTRETSWLFNLFYSMTSTNGYHPSPTLFNLLFTIAVGTTAGILARKKIAATQKTKQP